jgi:hypothetical protein
MKLNAGTVVLGLFLLFIFYIGLSKQFTILYAFSGVIVLWAYRFTFNKPSAIKALTIGANAAFWMYIAYIICNLVFYHTICICIFIHFWGLVINPIISASMAFLTNFIPDFKD